MFNTFLFHLIVMIYASESVGKISSYSIHNFSQFLFTYFSLKLVNPNKCANFATSRLTL